MLLEECAPIVIYKRAVGLEGVADGHARRAVLLLKGHGLAEEIQPHEGRLAALPGKGHLGHALGGNVLAGVIF